MLRALGAQPHRWADAPGAPHRGSRVRHVCAYKIDFDGGMIRPEFVKAAIRGQHPMTTRSSSSKQCLIVKVAQRTPVVRVDYPKEGAVLEQGRYTFRIHTDIEAQAVELSINQESWAPCREALGLWWYDWAEFERGEYVVAARIHLGNGVAACSAPRRFSVR